MLSLTWVDSSLALDLTPLAEGTKFSSGKHGFAQLSTFIRCGQAQAFYYYNRPGIPRVLISDGCNTIYEGRVEDVAIVSGGVQVTALGYWRAFYDVPYTALLSQTNVSAWRTVLETDRSGWAPQRYAIDTNARIFIGLTKNTVYPTGNDIGGLYLPAPSQGARQIVAIAFDYAALLPTNWTARCVTDAASWAGGGSTPWSLTGNNALQSGTMCTTFSGEDLVEFDIYNSTGSNYTCTAETGAYYLRVSNLRVATETTDFIDTTLGTTIAAGTRTVTPGSMARIFVGQRLYVGSNLSTGESVVVTAITSTTFTAAYVNAHNNTETVRAIVLNANRIASALVAYVSGVNSGQLSTGATLIDNPAVDLTDEVYEDAAPADILDRLSSLGDNSTPPDLWEAGVLDNKQLYFRQRGSQKAWYVDAINIPNIERTLDALANSAYAVYQDANRNTVRSASNPDTDSIAGNGITRRIPTRVSTTNSTQATNQRDAVLADGKNPLPRLSLPLGRLVYDASGAVYPSYLVRAGDTVTIRNIPPTAGTSIDRIRTFRVAETNWTDGAELPLNLVPESPLPALDLLTARTAAGLEQV